MTDGETIATLRNSMKNSGFNVGNCKNRLTCQLLVLVTLIDQL